MTRPPGAALLAVGLSFGCASGDAVTWRAPGGDPSSPTVVAARDSTVSPGGDASLDAETARAEATRILAEVAQARNLGVQKDVKIGVVSRQGIREFAKKSLYETITPDKLRLFGRIESSLGTIPLGADHEKVLLDLLEGGVLGFYDPKRETLLIGDFVSKGMLSMVVGHEIAHGLQDMHFDLEAMREPLHHRSDAEEARTFLIEGDAQASYLAWVSGDRGLEAIGDEVFLAMGNQALEYAELASPYPVLARRLQLPYADGAATVAQLAMRRGWKAVNKLYDDLPTTSEQMLHIDKLLAREKAIKVRIDADPLLGALPGFRSVWHDTLGEAALLAMLAEVEPSIVARRSAAGWGGDALVALEQGRDRPLVVCAAIAWDSNRDAEDFESSFAKYLDEHIGGAYFLDRRKDRVAFATRLPEDVDPRDVQAALWRGLKVHKRGKA